MFLKCFRTQFLQICQRAVPLHRVFHSIRFKVIKGWGYSGIPFFVPFCDCIQR